MFAIKRLALTSIYIMVFACTIAHAADKQPAVVVWIGDTEYFSFFVSDNPRFLVEQGNALLQSDGEWSYESKMLDTYTYQCSVAIPMSESSGYRITFEERSYTGMTSLVDTSDDSTNAIGSVEASSRAPQFSMKDGQLRVSGLAEGEAVSVSMIDGKALATTVAAANGFASLQLPRLKDVVVVKAGSVTFKIVIK